jgi:hypothetical protein
VARPRLRKTLGNCKSSLNKSREFLTPNKNVCVILETSRGQLSDEPPRRDTLRSRFGRTRKPKGSQALRTSQTIKQTTKRVPTIPYPNIVVSCVSKSLEMSALSAVRGATSTLNGLAANVCAFSDTTVYFNRLVTAREFSVKEEVLLTAAS